MAKSRWDHTATIVATIAGLFDKSATVEKANPYRRVAIGKSQGATGDFTEKTKALDLPKWEPPDY